MNEINSYSFRIINGIYPDLDNYKYYLNLTDIGISLVVIEQWTTGKLYIVDSSGQYVVPLRYNTNLLPSNITNYSLVYNFDKQKFIVYSLNDL